MDTDKKTMTTGHLVALATILVWGTTFISTKILLRDFTPIEILFIRFVIGYLALCLFYPKRLKLRGWKERWYFIGAGASGITFYYLLENIALTLTTASNVSIIVAIAPFFIGILSSWFLKTEKPRPQFYIGFVAAIAGIALISYNGSTALQLNPTGDVLAILAAATWAVYSILIRKIGAFGHNTIQVTRCIFFYGLLFMVPMLFVMGFRLGPERFAVPANLGNMLFLGIGAGAICFVTWNTAVKLLGAVKTSVYIYLVPVVTVAASVVILKEPLTPVLILGAALTLLGLWLSETRVFQRKKPTTQPPGGAG